jgi:catechol 2,3-dioxygenase-like lactoylglutathione lyase family enzyme
MQQQAAPRPVQRLVRRQRFSQRAASHVLKEAFPASFEYGPECVGRACDAASRLTRRHGEKEFVLGRRRGSGNGTRSSAAAVCTGAVRGTLSGMTLKRMDNVGVVVDDLAAAVAFFKELGLELEGEAQVKGRSVDRLIGLDGVRADIAMMRTPDGHGRLELTKFRRPTADSAEPNNAPPNTLGIRRIMFAVEDIDDVVARLRAHGAELVGELVQYENSYRLCYVRGPEGILVALAEKIG